MLLCFFLAASAHAAMPSPGIDAGFQPNLGQFDERVAFWAEGDSIDLFVTRRGELVHRLRGQGEHGWVLVERLENARPLQPLATSITETGITWLGDGEARSANSATQIGLGMAWPGIRAELEYHNGFFEKRFHLDPGADASSITLSLDGVDGLQLATDGRLLLSTGLGEVELSAPIAWQDVDGQRHAVEVEYALKSDNQYGFSLGEYNANHAVTIDPIIRSTFSGGGGDEGLDHLEVASDSVYVTGNTNAANFPGTTGGYQATKAGSNFNIFIARYSLDLTTLLQATYFSKHDSVPDSGGISDSPTVRTLVATADSVYINGRAPGRGTHIPTTTGALQTVPGGGSMANSSDGFVVRFSRDLTQLLAATYYGGSGDDTLWPMVVSDTGVFVAGSTNSDTLAGLTNGAVSTAPTPAGSAFVAKLSLDLSTAISASWITGGGWSMEPRAMALGASGSVYIAGDGSSTLFETTGAVLPNRTSSGFNRDGFIVHLNSDLSTILRSTYLGSSGHDRIDSLAFANGNLYAAGNTGSASFPVPVGGAIPTWASGSAFVAQLAADLTAIDGASFYRGNVGVSTAEVLVNGSDVFLTGTTTATTLPATEGSAEPTNPGGTCGFAAAFNLALTTINQSTFVACGGNTLQVFGADSGNSNLYLAGRTRRNDLPNSATGAQPARASGGSYDAFIIAMTADLAGPKPNADIAVTKTGSPQRLINKYVRYWVTVTNNGPDGATEVLIEDILPNEVGAASWRCEAFGGATCPQNNGNGDIALNAALPVGGGLELQICAEVDLSDEVSNTATASVPSHTLDPVGDNNSATAVMNDPRLFADGFEDTDLPDWCPNP
jgi:uncharacterized repeat protein (TIGR01451 family)